MKEIFEYKYNLYDIVYINYKEKPNIDIHKGKIISLIYYKERCDDKSDSEPLYIKDIYYYLKLDDNTYAQCSEEEIYTTKEELLKALNNE